MNRKDFILPCRVSSGILRIDASGVSSYEQMTHGGDATVVFVTGEAVGSRKYDTSDPIVRRIETNADLYVSVHDNATLDYVRKSAVDSVVKDSEGHIIGVVVCRNTASVDMETEVKAICIRRLSLSALKRDMPLSEYLASRFLKRVLLPALLVYLAVLLANFFIHSRLTERLGEIRSAYAKESVEAKKRAAVTQAHERLYAEYRAIQDVDMSGLSDDVASLVPDDIRLTLLAFNGPRTRICGDAFSYETVMSFVD
ncbi:MAG: hypothetical protein K2O58_06015, partial [Bacteroidales bacterium]|nr:hypothetical protein [Bacteroidales bacterium]